MAWVASTGLSDVALWERWARERPRTPIAHPRPPKKSRRPAKVRVSHRRAMGTLRAVIPWAVLLIVVVSALSFVCYRGWTLWSSGPTLISDDIPSLSRFVETRVGQVVVPVDRSNGCRRVLFHNDSGLMRDMGLVSCHEPDPPVGQTAGVGDRLGALRGAFRK